MKTFNVLKRFVQVFALAAMTLGLANCSKDSGSGTSTRYQCYSYYNNTTVDNYNCVNSAYNSGSYYSGATQYVCKDTSTGYQVSNSLCSNSTTTNGYSIQNNMCYYNGAVQSSLQVCYNAGVTTTGTGAQSCVGNYHNGQTWYQCGTVHNCAGVQLYNQYNQIVTCY